MRRSAAPTLTLLFGLLAAGVLPAGCGNSRTPTPSLTIPAAPSGFRTLGYPSADLTLAVPASWSVTHEKAPMLAAISSATAVIALWRYPRSRRAPTGVALSRALVRLIGELAAAQPGIRLLASRPLSVGGRPALQIEAIERIRGTVRRVLSTHVFLARAEVVLDEYAPTGVWARVESSVFGPVRTSMLFGAQ